MWNTDDLIVSHVKVYTYAVEPTQILSSDLSRSTRLQQAVKFKCRSRSRVKATVLCVAVVAQFTPCFCCLQVATQTNKKANAAHHVELWTQLFVFKDF